MTVLSVHLFTSIEALLYVRLWTESLMLHVLNQLAT